MAGVDLQALLRASRDMATGLDAATQYPPIARDAAQVAELSRQLAARTARLDGAAEANAGVRLLAREGVDADRLMRDLRGFELRTTYAQDRGPALSLDDYLAQQQTDFMREAVADCQRDAAAECEAFLLDAMEREWDAEKAVRARNGEWLGLGASLGAFGAAGGAAAPPTPGPVLADGSATPAAAAAAAAADPFAPALGGGAAAAAAERARKYYEVMQAINTARATGAAIDAAARFRDAAAAAAGAGGAASAASGAPGGATLPEMWLAVSCVLSGGGEEASLVAGALTYLQQGHERYMRAVVAATDAATARAGLPLVQAFLRVKLRSHVALDFDSLGQGGAPAVGAVLDTAWQAAYYCLRSGYAADAAEVAASAARGGAGGADVAAALAELARARCVSPAAAQRAADDAARALAEPAHRPGRLYRAALGAALSGDTRLGDEVHGGAPELVGTIEDFLWHKLRLVAASLPPPGAPPGTPAASSAPGLSAYTLADLQGYLGKFEAAHFAKGGREPLLAAVVLALSCRLRALLRYLVADPLAEGHAEDGVHVAAALTAGGGLRGAGGERGGDVADAAAALLAAHARRLAPAWPLHAAEYFILAAQAAAAAARAAGGSASAPGGPGDADAVASALLRELLRHPGAAPALLGGAAGCDGHLARFVPDAAQRRRLVAAAAAECAAAALYEPAIDLFVRAGDPVAALALVNRRLADALAAEVGGAAAPRGAPGFGELADRSRALAEEARTAGGGGGGGGEAAAWAALCAVRELLRAARAGDNAAVLRDLLRRPELAFVPLDPLRVDRTALDVLHAGVAARLPDVLLAAAAAVASPSGGVVLGSTQARQAAMAALESAARFRIPPHAQQQLARLTTAALA